MRGGRLPSSFEAVDCELYAAYKFLIDVWKAAGTAAKRATERVLLLSDCKPASSTVSYLA